MWIHNKSMNTIIHDVSRHERPFCCTNNIFLVINSITTRILCIHWWRVAFILFSVHFQQPKYNYHFYNHSSALPDGRFVKLLNDKNGYEDYLAYTSSWYIALLELWLSFSTCFLFTLVQNTRMKIWKSSKFFFFSLVNV